MASNRARSCWQAVFLCLAPLISAQTQNYFIQPPSGGAIPSYGDDIVLTIGSPFNIWWNSTLEFLQLGLYQNNTPSYAVLEDRLPATLTVYRWLVEISSFGFSLEKSNIFCFVMWENASSTSPLFTSHYVKIWPAPIIANTSSSLDSSTTSVSRTSMEGTSSSSGPSTTSIPRTSRESTSSPLGPSATSTPGSSRNLITTAMKGHPLASASSGTSLPTGLSPSSSHSSEDIWIGVGVGVGIAALLIAVAIAVCFYRKRRKQRATSTHTISSAPSFRHSNSTSTHDKAELPSFRHSKSNYIYDRSELPSFRHSDSPYTRDRSELPIFRHSNSNFTYDKSELPGSSRTEFEPHQNYERTPTGVDRIQSPVELPSANSF